MSQSINDNFRLVAGLSLDERYYKTTISARDSIETTRRFEGLQCYVLQTNTLYILIGGTDNTHWSQIGGASTSNNFYLVDTYPFIWQKGRNRITGVINTANEMEANDLIINGFANYDGAFKLIKLAEYVSGDPTLIASYNVLEFL